MQLRGKLIKKTNLERLPNILIYSLLSNNKFIIFTLIIRERTLMIRVEMMNRDNIQIELSDGENIYFTVN